MSEKKFKSGNVFDVSVLWKLFHLTSSWRSKLFIAIGISVTIALLGPIRPYFIQLAIDHAITNHDSEELIRISALILFLLILQSGLQVWGTILTNFIGQEVIKDLRLKVYRYLTSLRVSFYDKNPVGTLVTRTVSDIETIADVFSEGMINIIGDLLQVVVILIMMFSTDWKLSLVSLSVLPFLIYAGYVFKEKVRKSFEDVRNQVARLNTFVQEHIQGMQVVQLFNRQEREMDQFIEINKDHRDANIRSVMYYSIFFPVVELIAALSTALILWYGSMGVLDHVTTVGTLVAFIMYIGLFFRPVRQLADRFNTLQMGMVASERIFRLIEKEDDIEPVEGSMAIDFSAGIQFDRVDFSYGEHPVLRNISFSVAQGKTLALVGATGSGKSTIINLLNKFYLPVSGTVFIGGKDARQIHSHTLRRRLGTVLQDVFLFSGSVLDNIRLYNESITRERVIETARLLGAHDFISKLPHGYDQQVQERGMTLSFGQRQLISFVRAMVTDPAILVLDEATASVDHQTEAILQKAIATMLQGRTSIIVAHRLSTIRHVDEILVLDKGEIVERGTHDSLLAAGGHYKQLYEIQFETESL